MDRALRRQSQSPLAVEGEIDHHDAVLLYDADQQNNSDKCDNRKFGP